MALDQSDIETRTLALERKVNRLFAVVDDMVIFRVPRLEQQLAMLWSLPPRRVAQITGQVDGCASQGFPGATVRILNASGERLGTGKCDSSGHYTALANLESDPQTVTIEATPVGTYASRFNGPATDSVSANVGDNSAPTITIPPAATWCCGAVDYFPGDCGPPPPCESGRICVTVQASGCSLDLVGVSVTVEDADGVEIGSGVTSGSPGKVCFDIPTAGTYTVTAHVPGVTDQTADVNAVCDVDNNVTLTYPPNSIVKLCFGYTDCDCDDSHPMGGSVSFSEPGGISGTVSLDGGTGQGCIIVAGNKGYTATLTGSNGYTETRSASTISTFCTTVTVNFASVSAIAFAAGQLPAGCTMTFTMLDPVTGSCSVTGDGVTPAKVCCVTFDRPIDRGHSNAKYSYKSSGPLWDNVGFFSVDCYTTSFPFLNNFGNVC